MEIAVNIAKDFPYYHKEVDISGDLAKDLVLKTFYEDVLGFICGKSTRFLNICCLERFVDTLTHLYSCHYLSQKYLGEVQAEERIVFNKRFENNWEFLQEIYCSNINEKHLSSLIGDELEQIIPFLPELDKAIMRSKNSWASVEEGESPHYLDLRLSNTDLIDKLKLRKPQNGSKPKLRPFLTFCDKVWFNCGLRRFTLSARPEDEWQEKKGVILVDERFNEKQGIPILFEYYSYLKIKEKFLKYNTSYIGSHNLMIKSGQSECEIDLLFVNTKTDEAFVGECTISGDKEQKVKQLKKVCELLNKIGLNIKPSEGQIVSAEEFPNILQALPP
ncbi:MAG: hypothetical protein QW282_07330 [Nitrososphaerales archaeon]